MNELNEIERLYPHYEKLTEFLSVNGLDWTQHLYKSVVFVLIPSISLCVIIRNNKKESNYVIHHLTKGYLCVAYGGGDLKSTSFKKIEKYFNRKGNCDIKKIPEPSKKKKQTKKQESTYDYAERMLNNPTKAEKRFAEILKENNIQFVQQEVIECVGKKYIADFVVNNKLIVEVDGGYHYTEEQKKLDKQRTIHLNSEGYEVIRIDNNEVLKETNTLKGIILYIKNYLNMKEFSDNFKTLLIKTLKEYDLHIIKNFYELGSPQSVDMICHLCENKYTANEVVNVIDWVIQNVHYPGDGRKF